MNKSPGPWTVSPLPNAHFSDRYTTYYILYWNGLARGQIIGAAQADAIAAQLNLGNVAGVSHGLEPFIAARAAIAKATS